MPSITVAIPNNTVTVLLSQAPITVTVPASEVSVICDDPLDTDGFTTPTLTDWSLMVEDLDDFGARFSVVEMTTAGSPCRVMLSLVHASASETYSTKYTSPEQLTPHTGIGITITHIPDRGLTYDLYWSWTSGNESAGPTLVAAAAIYVPIKGEGDQFSED